MRLSLKGAKTLRICGQFKEAATWVGLHPAKCPRKLDDPDGKGLYSRPSNL